MKFLRNLLASILGTLVAFGICFFMILLLAALAGTEDKGVYVPNNAVLELRLNEPIKDYGGKYSFRDLDFSFEKYNGLNNIIDAIAYAKTDNKIKGISINTNFIIAGYAQIQALRRALEDFKTSGKFVYAYGDLLLQKDYYLASVADSVFLNPVGQLDFRGLSSEVLYFKDFQEKSGVKMEVVRHGKYKSAVEPYLENTMSDENREQISELLLSIWEAITNDIAKSRNIATQKLNEIADNLSARTPVLAKNNQLIDAVAYLDEYEDRLKEALHQSTNKDLNYIGIEKYAEYAAKKKRFRSKNKIAVLYAQGEILYGMGGDQIIGQDLMIKAIRDAGNDNNVKAIVLRVDSPGGAAIVADIIWRELEIAKQSKPVVVSMGNVAASGGYYIAAGAHKIYAEPTTVTGSIGVFSTIPNIEGLANKLGINAEQVATHKQAVGYSLFEPMSDDFRNYIEEGNEDTYTTFLERVASGRNIPVDSVHAIAQGRVWSGAHAKKIGLVDELGGLEDAIQEAANLANVENFTIVNYPEYETSIEEFLERLSGFPIISTKKDKLINEIGHEAYMLLQQLKLMTQQKGVQARLPYTLNIK